MDSKNCWLKNNCKQLHCDDKNGCRILFKLNYLYEEAGLELNLRANKSLHLDDDGTDLDKFKQLKEIQNNIVNWIDEGNNLLIHSRQCGNGKTSWAIKLLQTYFNKIWLTTPLKCRALFISVPQFLIALKDNISNKSEYITHIKENILDCDLVIWDDIANKSLTQYECDNLLSMIDGRIIKGKANIFTSNLNDNELHEALGDRLYSRICNYAQNIVFNGGDKRRSKING